VPASGMIARKRAWLMWRYSGRAGFSRQSGAALGMAGRARLGTPGLRGDQPSNTGRSNPASVDGSGSPADHKADLETCNGEEHRKDAAAGLVELVDAELAGFTGVAQRNIICIAHISLSFILGSHWPLRPWCGII